MTHTHAILSVLLLSVLSACATVTGPAANAIATSAASPTAVPAANPTATFAANPPISTAASVFPANSLTAKERAAGWQLLFDGKSLAGWKASGAPGTFSVASGDLVVLGGTSHLYYTGPVHDHDFKNFELELDVMTWPNANSGVYFHTAWQPNDWPAKGFEVQVNNSQEDPKRTAGLYDIKENYAKVAQDNVWFTLRVLVEGKHVRTYVDGRLITDYTEPDGFVSPKNHPQRRIDHGTFALQGHDPGSEVHYRNIKVRSLP